jgi:hypothetical protein
MGHTEKRGFVIDGLTRTGSTTLAALLNCHPDIRCLIEPFHPRRFDGQFHAMAMAGQSVGPVLELIWYRWVGIKHVWESTGWPFAENPKLNDEVVLGAKKVIFLRRRNLLRRSISSLISRQLRFWVGTREELYARLENVQLRNVTPDVVIAELKRDQEAIQRRLLLFLQHNVEAMHLFYEDLYAEDITIRQRVATINDILGFLGFAAIGEDVFQGEWAHWVDPNIYRWSSADLYRRIPGIQNIENAVGCDETGWLFRDFAG